MERARAGSSYGPRINGGTETAASGGGAAESGS